MNSAGAWMPTVTVVLPVLNEEAHLGACLQAVEEQTYRHVIEVLVADGGSIDRTTEIASTHPSVRVVHNPRRIQAAGLNVALAEARGEVIVRVDGHCTIASDYVERCVDALRRTGAAVVGGAMTPTSHGWLQRAVAIAMSSRLGAGPARFHVGGECGWVDTVYLGAYRADLARAVGGYAEDVGVNEDAEFAVRAGRHGGVWFDPAIRSTYAPRDRVTTVARQFFRYGRSRAATVRRHPQSVSPRQLVAPALVLGLLSPWRRAVAASYMTVVAGRAATQLPTDPGAAGGLLVCLPAMHLPWGAGFLVGLARPPRAPASRENPSRQITTAPSATEWLLLSF